MKIIKLLALILVTNISLGQIVFKKESIGFSIEQPNKWILAKESESIQNLKSNVKLDDKVFSELIEQNKGKIQVVTFFKYPIETTAGIIPTIKINLRSNPHKNFADFRKSIEASYSGIKKVFPDFKFTTEPNESIIDGKKCISASCIYTLTSKNGSAKVKINAYAVPVKDQFYQVTLMDNEEEDNTELFKKIVGSIKIK